MLSRAFAVASAILGAAVAARMLVGPEGWFRSPLNVESGFAVAVVAALVTAALRAPGADAAAKRRLSGRDAVLFASIAMLIAILFWRAAGFGFLSDDFVLLKLARNFGANYRGVFSAGGGDGFFRPLTYISLAWTWPWAGMHPATWHWTGLALHMASSLVVFALAAWLGFSRSAAWFAAALFAVHGSRPEAVVWMAGRFDLLAGLFALVSLAAFVRAWAGGRWWWGVAIIAAAVGMLSKESAYALPLMVAVFAAAQRATWDKKIRFVAPVTILAAILFAYRWTRLGGIGGYLNAAGEPQALSLSVVAVAKALVLRMWAVLFFPVDWEWTPGMWMAAVTLLYVAAWAAVVWIAKPNRRLLLMALGFTVAAGLPPVQQLLIGADLEKARLLYLPSAGFCLLAAAAVDGAGGKLKAAAMAAMLLFQAVALEHNLSAWEYAAGKAKTVCEAATACSNPPSGVPRTLHGVYFFANGLTECADLRRLADAPVQACSLRWDAEREELK